MSCAAYYVLRTKVLSFSCIISILVTEAIRRITYATTYTTLTRSGDGDECQWIYSIEDRSNHAPSLGSRPRRNVCVWDETPFMEMSKQCIASKLSSQSLMTTSSPTTGLFHPTTSSNLTSYSKKKHPNPTRAPSSRNGTNSLGTKVFCVLLGK